MKLYNFFKKNTSKFVERWHSDAFSDRKTAIQIFKDVKKRLRIIPHPYVGWRSAPNQKFKTVNINENGLRSKSLKSLKHKENCFFLGASVTIRYFSYDSVTSPFLNFRTLYTIFFWRKVCIPLRPCRNRTTKKFSKK